MDELSNLSPNNFYSVCDVASDIYEKLQMTNKDEISIPFWKNYVGFPLAILSERPTQQRGSYKESRRFSLEYLMGKGFIKLFFDERSGNFKEFLIRVDRNIFEDFFKLLKKEYEKRNTANIAQQENKTKGSLEKDFFLKLIFNEKTREIIINSVCISRPNFDSSNHSIFEFLYKNEGKSFTKKELGDELKIEIKELKTFLNEINIKGTIKKYLFSVSKNKIVLHKEALITNKKDIKDVKNELNILGNKKVEKDRS